MTVQLNKINPKFRQLTDLLCLSDRLDLDLSEFKELLRANFNDHYNYLWDRLTISFDIFWEEGEQFWSNRFSFLFSLNEKSLIRNVEAYLEKRAFQLIREKERPDPKYDVELQQFVEFCKIKRLEKESFSNLRDYLIDLPSQTNLDKLIGIVNSFIPTVFSDMEDYVKQLVSRITHSVSNFDFLLALEKRGFNFDRQPLAQVAEGIITGRSHNEKNCSAFLYLIDDKGIRNLVKKEYHLTYNQKVISLLDSATFRWLEERQFINIKNVLDLEPSLADDLVALYAEKIYERHSRHKTANIDKLIRLARTCPEISPRKIISFLSIHNKVSDVKYVVSAFPELKKLAAFV